MGKQLVIVESPAKAKTINRYLGPEYVVEASVGHVRDLPKSAKGQPIPGVDIEKDFTALLCRVTWQQEGDRKPEETRQEC